MIWHALEMLFFDGLFVGVFIGAGLMRAFHWALERDRRERENKPD